MIISDIAGLTKCSERRVMCKCDTCGVVTQTTFANYFRSQETRKRDGKTYCRSCACKVTAQKKIGKPAHNKGVIYQHLRGENHPKWKGGTYVSSDGYRMILVSHDNNITKWKNYKKEHIVVMESKLDRKLLSNEVIHHVDGDKLNNSIDNLWLTNHRGHRIVHNSLQELAYNLVKNGLIKFDSGTYFLVGQ